MKQENFTRIFSASLSRWLKLSILPAFMILVSYNVDAQNCPLGCNNNVQISLDDDCEVEVTADMILEGQGPSPDCDYVVTVLGSNNQPIPTSPVVNGDYIGQTLKVRVSLGANSCWGTISIEDKLAPVIDCPDDVMVECYQTFNPITPSATDNCDNAVEVKVLSDVTTDLGCGSTYSATRVLVYQAEDDSGNLSELCTRTIYYTRIGLADIEFPLNHDGVEQPVLPCSDVPNWDDNNDGYPDPSETGVPTTISDGSPIYPNTAYCELNATFTDQRIDVCESTFKVIRTWVVLDWCTGEIAQDFQVIKVEDFEGPVVTCEPDDPHAAPADPYDCSADWQVPDPIVAYDCSSWTYEVDYLLADENGDPPVDGFYIDDNVTGTSGNYTINDLPLGRTWIRYTVTDACGNSTECFTEIDVFDNVPPVPVCDEFTVVTLTTDGMAWVKAETFDDGSHDNCTPVSFDVRRMTSGCGVSTSTWDDQVKFCCADVGDDIMVALRVTDEDGNENTCMVTVHVQDKIDPVISCPDDIDLDCGDDYTDLTVTGMATGSDNCGNPTITHSDSGSLNNCGTGNFTRTWVATDAGGRTASCTQRIRVIDMDPFSSSDITWPSDRNLTGCMNVDTDPSVTGEPNINDDECSLVASTYNDQVFTFVDGACFKILRTWSVIDWCTFDQNNPGAGGYYQYTQVIKLNNGVAPTFASCSNVSECGYGSCNGYIELIGSATDDCTPENELSWSYVIDYNNDGSINRSGSTNNASGTYDVGTHRIEWTVEDNCGNPTVCEHLFTIRDCKKPTPYCRSEVTTVIMQTTQEIDIWASDFDLGSTDNCTDTDDLYISFSTNRFDTQRVFDCDDLGINTLEMWVTDAAGNQDFCSVKVNIQANGDICGNSRIAGAIGTESNDMAEAVKVTLTNIETEEVMETETNTNGKFNFQGMEANSDYTIQPVKDGDYLNGVSTLDIVLVQRHILGLAKLDSPYKIIAADVNNSESLSASDLTELRKLILGLYAELPNNSSWRFVESAQEFADNSHPFPFNENINVMDFVNDDMDNDFKIIKIGDVNQTVEMANAKDKGSDTRNNKTLSLTVADVDFTNGEEVFVPVNAENFDNIFGYQFNLAYDISALEYSNIVAGAIDMTSEHVAVNKEGVLSTSWNDVEAVSFDSDEVLFTLVFRAKTNGTINGKINLTSDQINAEAYDQTLTPINVSLSVRSKYVNENYELFQNSPNPFSEVTNISFYLPKTQKATIKFFDVAGKILNQVERVFDKGMNTIEINTEDLNTQGILYYELSTSEFTDTKKMIIIQ